MSALRRLLAATAAAGVAGAGAVVWAASRPRRAHPQLTSFDPPPDLPPGRLVTVPGHGEMFVRDLPGPTPAAPTVVLLHGWMISADVNWFTSYRPLAQVARVLAVDHRGHGRGTRPAAPYRLAEVADDVAALLAELGTGPAVAVGYSMGGPVAQLLWQRHPEAVRGLVLCATAATFRTTRFQILGWRALGLYQVLLRLLPRATFERLLLAQIQGRLPFRVSQSLTEESEPLLPLLPWVVGELERGEPEDLAEAGRELSRYDSRGWIGTVDVPTAVVVTSRDRLVPPCDQRAMAALIPGARILEVSADHDAPGGQPEAFADTLVRAVRHAVDGQRAPAPARAPDLDPVEAHDAAGGRAAPTGR